MQMCKIHGSIGVLLVAAALTSAVGAEVGSQAPLRIKAVRVARQRMERTVRLAGTFRPWEEIDLFSRVQGYVKEIRVDRGDHVNLQDVLVVIDAPELSADVVSAGAQVAQARAEVARMQAESVLAGVTYARIAAVRRQSPEGISVETVDEMRAKRDVARRAVDVATAREATARAALQRAKVAVDLTRIQAPFQGVVTERFVDRGAFVPAGAARSATARLLHLANLSRLRLQVPVPEIEAAHVAVGTTARFTMDALPGRSMEAKVSRIAGIFSPGSRTMAAEIDVENPKGDIPAGEFARVELVTEVHPNAFVVPPEAIVTVRKKPHLALIEGGRIQRRPVELGSTTGPMYEILGFKEGDHLVALTEHLVVGLNVSDSMVDGTPVTVELDEKLTAGGKLQMGGGVR